MLTGIMTLAICSLLATINESNPQDYVYAAMFMISTTCFLKIQWLVGTSFMMLPLALLGSRGFHGLPIRHLPQVSGMTWLHAALCST